MILVEDAPALPQPAGAVFVKVLPETSTPTALCHTTFSCGSVGPGAAQLIVLGEPESDGEPVGRKVELAMRAVMLWTCDVPSRRAAGVLMLKPCRPSPLPAL